MNAISNLVCKLDLKEIEHPLLLYYVLSYLYFLGLSLRNTSKALIIFKDDKREVMFLYGIGYKDLDPVKSIKEKEYLHS